VLGVNHVILATAHVKEAVKHVQHAKFVQFHAIAVFHVNHASHVKVHVKHAKYVLIARQLHKGDMM
jgi:hypothetical protein